MGLKRQVTKVLMDLDISDMKQDTVLSQPDREAFEIKMREKYGLKAVSGEKVILLKNR